ncbi:MAG: threonine--tRNA ligase [Nanoarchaeota archaeon]|nr:threonine--tRNA ligase [Nanoarchaeota archaeon]
MKLETLRHSCAHILADAVKQLYPKVKLGIGPNIEQGFYYDFDNLNITENDLKKIEKKMKEITKKDFKFKKIKTSKQKAKTLLKNEPYKLELLKEIKQPTFYQHNNFIDLCKGPHINSTKEIKYFKLLKIAGAYWKGDSKNNMLTRIYGTAFNTKQELDSYLNFLQEAEKRNHIKLGKQLDLFSMHPEAPGFPFLHSKGIIIWDILMSYWKQEHNTENYKEIRTPIILKKNLWEQSGHWDHYKDDMYFTKIDNNEYAIKPMNCPGTILIYKEKLHSYREFPLKLSEIGLVHRNELSGVLNGLFRVRAFHQDDAHIFCFESQIKQEVINIIKLIDRIYKTFNLNYEIELSTRPKKYIGTKKMWDLAEKELKNSLKNIKYKLNKGDGAFYGPKIDFHIKDSLNRSWQCGTIQLDFAMPEKFKLEYDGQDGKRHRSVMLHRTVYGSIERFIGILIEHYKGEFPLWLSPVQIKILNINSNNLKYAKEIYENLKENKIRTELDDRSESVSRKVRDAITEKVNYIINIGDKEEKNKTIAVRNRKGKLEFNVKIDSFIKKLKEEISSKT